MALVLCFASSSSQRQVTLCLPAGALLRTPLPLCGWRAAHECAPCKPACGSAAGGESLPGARCLHRAATSPHAVRRRPRHCPAGPAWSVNTVRNTTQPAAVLPSCRHHRVAPPSPLPSCLLSSWLVRGHHPPRLGAVRDVVLLQGRNQGRPDLGFAVAAVAAFARDARHLGFTCGRRGSKRGRKGFERRGELGKGQRGAAQRTCACKQAGQTKRCGQR